MFETQPPQIPLDSADELDRLAPLSPRLHEAIEGAAEAACQFFEQQGKDVDVWLFPSLARYLFLDFLKDRGNVYPGLEIEPINNNGVSFVFERRRYRMWKRPSDELPSPGYSSTKRDFLNQKPIQYQTVMFNRDAYLATPVDCNLAIIWTANGNNRVKQLYLSCPQSTTDEWTPATAYWTVPIPHPAEMRSAAAAPGPSTGDGSGEDLDLRVIPEKPAEGDSAAEAK